MTLLAWGLPAWNADKEAWELPITLQLLVYTTTPQQVQLNLSLYNVTGGFWEASKNITLYLAEGTMELIDTLPIFFNEILVGHEVRGYAEIVEFEEDTDTGDNAIWSNNTFTLPTFCDVRLTLVYEPVKQRKGQWYLLPEDTIRVAVGAVVPAPLNVPARLDWQVLSRDIKTGEYIYEKVVSVELTPAEPQTYWVNRTFVIPWTDKLVISGRVYYKWDICPFNNHDNVTLAVDTDAKIERVEVPSIVTEGDTITLKVRIVSNVPRGEKYGVILVFDNTTGNILTRVEVPLAPEVEIPVKIKVPENPPISRYTPFLHEPSRMLQLAVVLDAPDPACENNIRTVTLLVQATPLTILAMMALAMVAVLVCVGIVKSVVKAVEDVGRRRTRFVRRKAWS